ncbi:family 43 glycosylhydrolase [Saccharopolyspora dendranthemae]|uniref:Glycosyl hydrolase family 43 n=1 Tax=Saccharopolyspora dendranthemae TaxID=1181886 RepID=A0A561V8A2_9PSEU|nr:family 43 glycosylhydrolase [Saccharopolyspora dendranthemae]TWG07827.1 glycosyl hydrolase family 43 [Saccharopolyspora dendranthemae]
MSGFETGPHPNRRTLLLGAAGALGMATFLPAAGWGAGVSSQQDYPPNWPPVEPYGDADTRKDLEPRGDNSRVLDLELRSRDQELGRVWIRDTYVNRFVVDGQEVYVATGTTKVASRPGAAPWNDGIFLWIADSLDGPWKLVDTTEIRPDAEKGKVWSPEFVGENEPDRTVVAPWQRYAGEGDEKRGDVWAPEVHHFRGTWYIVACMGDHSRKVGSFLLKSEGGIAGPYRVVRGNLDKPFGELNPGTPDGIDPNVYYHIDGGIYAEGDKAWLVLHNDLYAEFEDDMEDIVQKTNLPKFGQTRYDREPYLEGAHVLKHEGKYYLMHAAWNKKTRPGGTVRQAYTREGERHQYDAIIAVSDHFEGPYSKRWTAGIGAGHNNLFVDGDGQVWATFFRNPAAGYWADPSRVDDAAVAGVVRVEWTGPEGNRLYVERRG